MESQLSPGSATTNRRLIRYPPLKPKHTEQSKTRLLVVKSYGWERSMPCTDRSAVCTPGIIMLLQFAFSINDCTLFPVDRLCKLKGLWSQVIGLCKLNGLWAQVIWQKRKRPSSPEHVRVSVWRVCVRACVRA